MDLAGSTLDIWPLYLFHENAVTVNFAVDRYTRATLEPRNGRENHVPLHRSAVASAPTIRSTTYRSDHASHSAISG